MAIGSHGSLIGNVNQIIWRDLSLPELKKMKYWVIQKLVCLNFWEDIQYFKTALEEEKKG